MKNRTKLAAPIFIPMLIGMALLIVFQISNSHKRDPLFTDLSAFPYYAINGFEASYAQIKNPSDLDWDLVLPPRSGRLNMSDMPVPETSPSYGRFSLADREIEEFTIFIPLLFDEAVNRLIRDTDGSSPALYFVGIGENWEVFVNGRSVAREIHLDNNGRIKTFKSTHGVTIPLDKAYLDEDGENSIVIHILGARAGKWTGLRYVAPYYLGDISSISRDYQSYANYVLCVLFLLAGLIHLLFYLLRKTARYNLLFTAFTVFAAAYYFIRTPLIYSIILNTEHIRRLDYSILYFFVFLGVAFIENINPGKLTKPTVAFGAVCTVFALGHWLLPIWVVYELLVVWQIGTILYLIYFVGYCLVWRFIKDAKHMSKDEVPKPGIWHTLYRYLVGTEFGNLCVLMVVLALTGILDIFFRVAFDVNFTISQFSYLAVVLGMTYVLAKKSMNLLEVSANEVKGAGLSPEETEIALLMVSGNTQRDITRKLHLSAADIGRHEESIRQKLNLTNVSEMGKSNKPQFGRFIIFSAALYLLILVVGSIAFVFSMRQVISASKHDELLQLMELERYKIEAEVNSDIAIALKMASSPVVRHYFLNPDDPEAAETALRDFEGYQAMFTSASVFWINDSDKRFYIDLEYAYIVDPDDPEQYWYDLSMYETDRYNFNIDWESNLRITNIWINAPVYNAYGEPIGVVGIGMDLSEFINNLYQNYTGKADLYYFNALGEITGARNVELAAAKVNIDDHLQYDVMGVARGLEPGQTAFLNFSAGPAAIGTIPALEWYTVSFLTHSIEDYRTAMTWLFLIVLALILLIFIIFNVFISRFLISLSKASETISMTARMREQMLVTENDILDRLNRMKNNFFQNMNHDFRTPLNVIATSMYNVKDMLDFEIDKEVMSSVIETAEQEVMRMARMVDSAMIYSSLADNKQIMEPVDIAPLLRKGAETYRALLERHDNLLSLDIPHSFPPVFGSADMLLHVLSNLLSNANRYTRKGTISIHATEDDGIITVRVRDEGTGIKAAMLPLIFERGVSEGGTGLGLSICKTAIETHGGTITAESEYGRGTQITFTLPVYFSNEPDAKEDG